jgi:peptidoglycan/LPS O-acetylase OafA/YrhL
MSYRALSGCIGHMTLPAQGRSLGLDLLRLIAVVLVMGSHLRTVPDKARWLIGSWNRGGWIGVDVFFVLSGFLVSGLLFREYARTGAIDAKTFLIRRAWKIYPAFWVMIAFTLIVQFFVKPPPAGSPAWKGTLAELLFVQNYVPGLWGHTWSLAVEEHFYIALAMLLGYLAARNVPLPFACLPRVFISLALACLILRLATDAFSRDEPYDWFRYCGTHLRLDSLFFGVLISYLCHFHDLPLRLAAVPSTVLVFVGVVCLLPAFIVDISQHHWLWPGLVVALYVGAGSLVLAAIRLQASSNALLRGCAQLGAASYSIYLWHMAINIYCTRPVERLVGISDFRLYLFVYVFGSLSFGWLMSRLIESPLLVLRDQMWPSRR